MEIDAERRQLVNDTVELPTAQPREPIMQQAWVLSAFRHTGGAASA